LKTTISWDIMLCSPLNVTRRFGGTYFLLLHYLCSFIPHHMTTTHLLNFPPSLVGPLPLTALHFSLVFPRPAAAPFQGHSKLLFVSYWFARESQWVLTVSFCPTGEPTGTEFHSSISILFLYNTKFWLADCSACHLLSRWFLAQCYIPEDSTLYNNLCKNLKSYILEFISVPGNMKIRLYITNENVST
jgi:hypothetical protein